jgi:PAS domain-containing protein
VETASRIPGAGRASLIVVGMALSALFWVLEAAVHVVVFEDSGLTEQIFTPHGHEIWMRLTVVAMFMAFGFYSHRLLAARRRAEEQARTASAQVSQIFETAADGMRVVDRDFTVTCANETFASLVGMPKGAIVGRKCFDVFRGDLCHTPRCPLEQPIGNPSHLERPGWLGRGR